MIGSSRDFDKMGLDNRLNQNAIRSVASMGFDFNFLVERLDGDADVVFRIYTVYELGASIYCSGVWKGFVEVTTIKSREKYVRTREVVSSEVMGTGNYSTRYRAFCGGIARLRGYIEDELYIGYDRREKVLAELDSLCSELDRVNEVWG
jgi:hypothetical protein